MNEINGTGIRLRELNFELLKAVLKVYPGGVTKQFLAEKTGLSLATCGTLVTELVKTGEVLESARSASGGGRPPRLYTYNNTYAMSALLHPAVENGVRILTCCVADAAGRIIWRESHSPGVIDFGTLAGALATAAERFPVRAAAVSFPGPVRNGLPASRDLPELDAQNLTGRLQERFGFAVCLDNDMNFAAAGYYNRFVRHAEKSLCYLSFPPGRYPGGGIIVDGRLTRGFSGFAGEVSFLSFGISRGQQALRLANRNGLIGQLGDTLAALAAVVNPEIVVLAGELPEESMREPVMKLSRELIPAEHLPALVFRGDPLDDCLFGMSLAAQELLAPPVRLVRRR